MFFYLTSRIISAVVAFLYPGYASFKTLSQRPASEAELERWLTYWSVLGCIVFVEYVAEWLVSWIPFYFLLKTLFLLYLVLPQTQGSRTIYDAHVAPFFRAHEHQIDAALGHLRARAVTFVQTRTRMVWDALASTATGQSSQHQPSQPSAAPPSMSDPVSGPTQALGSLWRAYGPAIIASGTALLSQTSRGADAGITTPPGGPSRINSSSSATQRQTQAQSQAQEGYDVGSGRFEEVEVPSDEEDGTSSTVRGRGGSWFGWGSGGPSAQGYERVKSD